MFSVIDTNPKTEANQLRRMADWHRAYADTTGSAHERDSRLRFADFLDRLAAEKDAKERIKETKQDPRFSKH